MRADPAVSPIGSKVSAFRPASSSACMTWRRMGAGDKARYGLGRTAPSPRNSEPTPPPTSFPTRVCTSAGWRLAEGTGRRVLSASTEKRRRNFLRTQFNPHSNPMGGCSHFPHFMATETEAQKGEPCRVVARRPDLLEV